MRMFDGDVKFKFTGCEQRIVHNPSYRELSMILEMLKTRIENGYEIDDIDVKKNLRSI